jgi:hypothetical protein
MSSALSRLADRLRDAERVTPELFSQVIRDACRRLPSVQRTMDFEHFQQFVQSGAWTDAALALLALETPQWHLRQMIHDAGEWHCTLSRRRELPDWLDQPAEARHSDLCLAILSAVVDVKRDGAPEVEGNVAPPSRADEPLDVPLCCDNFM